MYILNLTNFDFVCQKNRLLMLLPFKLEKINHKKKI
jgi:hypothetical protein